MATAMALGVAGGSLDQCGTRVPQMAFLASLDVNTTFDVAKLSSIEDSLPDRSS